MISKTVHGVVLDGAIQIDGELGIPDGQIVEIVVRTIDPPRVWGDGLRRSAGSMAGEWTDEDDRILDEIHQERKQDSRREPGE